MLRMINLWRDEQPEEDETVELPEDAVVQIPEHSWRRRLDNILAREIREFGVSAMEGIRNMGLGYRMWRHVAAQRKLGKEVFMDPFTPMNPSPSQGVPLGGLGAGSITRGWRGDFQAYQHKPGRVSYTPILANQFSVYIKREGLPPMAVVLNPRAAPTNCLQDWDWNMVGDHSYYCALFPRAWTVYEEPDRQLRLTCKQISPVIAQNYVESSYPVCVFEWTVENLSEDTSVEVSIMFTHQNGLGKPTDGAGGHTNTLLDQTVRGAISVEMNHHMPMSGSEENADSLTFAIATRAPLEHSEHGGATNVVSHKTWFRTDDRGTQMWNEFKSSGILLDTPEASYMSRQGETIGAALATKVIVGPGSTETVPFALSWYASYVRFGEGRAHPLRYAKYFSNHAHPATQIAAIAISEYEKWDRLIERWQQPILDDEELPSWYKTCLINELYYLVAGGSVWVDVNNIDSEEKEREEENIGRFLYLEGHEYLMYNTYDVHFYASWALIMLWPHLQLSIQRDFAEATLSSSGENMVLMASGTTAPRNVQSAVPHDLGGPPEDPWHKVNIYNIHDTAQWKDLNSKFVLQVYRDFIITQDYQFVRQVWPAALAAIEYLSRFDADNDSMIENSGFPDQTYDAWSVTGVSAYSGGLWTAALGAAAALAREVGDREKEAEYLAKHNSAAEVLDTKLWNNEGGYYNYDSSKSAHSKSIMADQLAGHWYTQACGLAPFQTEIKVRRALMKIYEFNVQKYAAEHVAAPYKGAKIGIGAVNGMLPTGRVDTTSLQSSEVWTGTTFALAANMIQEGLVKEGFATAQGIYESAYKRYGYWFQTPEAWDASGRYRAIGYMRPLCIWAMQWAWQKHKQQRIAL